MNVRFSGDRQKRRPEAESNAHATQIERTAARLGQWIVAPPVTSP